MSQTDPAAHEHSPPALDVLVAGLAGGVSDLAQTAHELLRQSMLTRVQRLVLSAVLFFLVISTSASVVALGILLHTSGQAKVQRQQQSDLSRTILDCTQPGGVCYERNQNQTAALISQLERNFLITVECADAHDGDTAISACVTERLRK